MPEPSRRLNRNPLRLDRDRNSKLLQNLHQASHNDTINPRNTSSQAAPWMPHQNVTIITEDGGEAFGEVTNGFIASTADSQGFYAAGLSKRPPQGEPTEFYTLLQPHTRPVDDGLQHSGQSTDPNERTTRAPQEMLAMLGSENIHHLPSAPVNSAMVVSDADLTGIGEAGQFSTGWVTLKGDGPIATSLSYIFDDRSEESYLMERAVMKLGSRLEPLAPPKVTGPRPGIPPVGWVGGIVVAPSVSFSGARLPFLVLKDEVFGTDIILGTKLRNALQGGRQIYNMATDLA